MLIQTQSDVYKFNGKDTLYISKSMDDYAKRIAIIKETIQHLSLEEAA